MSERNGVHPKQEAETENLGFLRVFGSIWWVISLVGTLFALLVWTLFIAAVGLAENAVRYKRQKPIDKEKFWSQVYICLIEFHGFDAERAAKAVFEKRKEVAGLTTPGYISVFYYRRPFDVANDIAGFEVQLSPEEYQERYVKKIMGL